MDIVTMIVGGALALLVVGFVLRLSYTILINLINGRKFHHNLEREFSRLRLNNMLSALGISRREYIYQNSVSDISQQMQSCSDCTNTVVCDEKLATEEIDISEIEFCNNEAKLKELKRRQAESHQIDSP